MQAQRYGSQKHDFEPPEHTRDFLAHEVELVAGSRLHALVGAASAPVNSMHHQGIQRLGDGLAATAHAPDGLIEAIEGRGSGFALGVQWHPESLEPHDDIARALFREFVSCDRRIATRRYVRRHAGGGILTSSPPQSCRRLRMRALPRPAYSASVTLAAPAQPSLLTSPPKGIILPNYDLVRVGQTEAIESGAVVARTTGPLANVYNPAGPRRRGQDRHQRQLHRLPVHAAWTRRHRE